jgi:hypothetical protein
MDLLSERINLMEPCAFDEAGTWAEVYDTDLVEWSESEGEDDPFLLGNRHTPAVGSIKTPCALTLTPRFS